MKLDAGIGKLRLGAGWQLASETEVTASTGKVWLDLTSATWDAREIDLCLRVATGKIEVIVPKGVAVQIMSANSRVTLDELVPPLPGAPLLRVVARTAGGGGRIRFTHEPVQQTKSHWWRRRKGVHGPGQE